MKPLIIYCVVLLVGFGCWYAYKRYESKKYSEYMDMRTKRMLKCYNDEFKKGQDMLTRHSQEINGLYDSSWAYRETGDLDNYLLMELQISDIERRHMDEYSSRGNPCQFY